MKCIAGRKVSIWSDAPQGNNMLAIFHMCYLREIFPSLLLDWKSPTFAHS